MAPLTPPPPQKKRQFAFIPKTQYDSWKTNYICLHSMYSVSHTFSVTSC